MKRLLLIGITGLLSLTVLAQDIAQDILAINQAWLSDDSYSLHMEYTVYDGYASSAVVERSKSVYAKEGLRSYVRYGDWEQLTHEEYVIMINGTSRKMQLFLREDQKPAMSPFLDVEQLKGWAQLYGQESEYVDRGLVAGYKLKTGDLRYPEAAFFFSKASHQLEKLVLYSHTPVEVDGRRLQKPRLEVAISRHPIGDLGGQLKLSRYVRKIDGQGFRPSADYHGFKISDNLSREAK